MNADAIRTLRLQGLPQHEAGSHMLWCMKRHPYRAPVTSVPMVQAAALDVVKWPADTLG